MGMNLGAHKTTINSSAYSVELVAGEEMAAGMKLLREGFGIRRTHILLAVRETIRVRDDSIIGMNLFREACGFSLWLLLEKRSPRVNHNPWALWCFPPTSRSTAYPQHSSSPSRCRSA